MSSDDGADRSEPAAAGSDRSAEALRRALLALKDMKTRVERVERAATEPIAIIGVGCRFPGRADSPEAFWELLRAGRDGVGAIPAERWDHRAYFDPDPEAAGKIYTDQAGFLDGPVDLFDAEFFSIAPVEARDLDPQQRLLLEVAWETLEHAGVAPDRLAGSPTGVFVGMGTFDYSNLQVRGGEPTDIGAYSGTGVASSVAAGRISYILGLRGPNVALDTACSSSLVAVSLAVQSLRAGACRMALAGGVNLMLEPQAMIFLSKFRALSPTGRCHTFGAAADGYVRGEGCGMVLLKRLSDAEADGDRILAIVRGAAVNHDGRSGGLTVPSGPAQREVIERALVESGLLATDIDLVEAHGTGTQLGDPIEVRALDAVYSKGRPMDQPLLLGSVKTNIGHLEAAAGIAGLLKGVLALQHEEIPAHLHCEELSPHIDWSSRPIEVNRELRPWRRSDRPRRVAVSAFGFSGTNAHVIIEEAPQPAVRTPAEARPVVIALSARNEAALGELAEDTADALESGGAIADVARTLQRGRARFGHRLAVTASTAAEAIPSLRAWKPGTSGVGASTALAATSPRVGFLFTGQGAQLPGMGRTLYAGEPVFREAMDECDAALRPFLPHSLLAVVYGDDAGLAALIHKTQYTQPAMFALQCALTALWRSWGIEPHVVAGHSIGEYAAAVTAGVMELGAAAELIAARGRLMGELPEGGRMVAVFADEDLVRRVVDPFLATVSIAACNGASNVVISGGADVDSILATLDSMNVRHRALEVSHAFHSPLMTPMLAEFAGHTDRVAFREPRLTFVSAVSGQAESSTFATAQYWQDHVLATVRFGDAINAVIAAGVDQFVEIGPQPTLLGIVARIRGNQDGLHASLRLGRGDRGERDERMQMADALGSLWVAGVEPDWHAIDGGRSITVDAPTYPFQRQRHWIPERTTQPDRRRRDTTIHPLVQNRVDSPAIKGHVYESQLSATAPAYLGDHRIFGGALMPATGYLEMALVAGREAFGEHVALTQVSLFEMLILPDNDLIDIQVVVGRPTEAKAEFSVYSSQQGRWRVHASGLIDLAPQSGEMRAMLTTGDTTGSVDPGQHYGALAARGVSYGPEFQTLVAIERGEGWAGGRLQLSARERSAASDYLIHPALLDGCLQLLAAALPAASRDEGGDAPLDDESVFLPIGVGEFHATAPAGSSARAVLRVHEREPSRPGATTVDDIITADIELFDSDDVLVMTMRQLKLRRVGQQVIDQLRKQLAKGSSLVDDSLYEVGWVRMPAPERATSEPGTSEPGTSEPGTSEPARATKPEWLVVAPCGGAGDALADELRRRGERVVVADSGAEPFDGLAAQVWSGVVVADHLDESEPVDDVLEQQRGSITAALSTVHGLLGGAGHLADQGRLWLLTRNTQSVDQQADPVNLAQAPLWGFANALSIEEPGLRVACIDLPPRGAAQSELLADELLATSNEDRIAFRGGRRLVPRLVRMRRDQTVSIPRGTYALDVTERGTLEGIAVRTVEPLLPEVGHVVIEVRASGLNFRDVLNVMGMYPGAVGDPGSEISGVVTAVGEGVDGISVGDEVIAIVDGSFRREVSTIADLVFPLPASIDFAGGAAMPIAFLTTHYGLHHLAAIRSGDIVLVHAAAGGVGMAAVRLAQLAGATVIGTAGSEEKRSLLRSIGVHHVLDSRSLDFAPAVLEITGGRGVDIALNSLSDDFIPATLGVVAAGGTFLEIGKRGVWSAEQVAQTYPRISYHLYDLSTVLRDDVPLIRSMMTEILTAVASGDIPPMPRRLFPIHDIRNAFRHMSMARQVGKVIITQPPAMTAQDDAAGRLVPGDGSYIISGGLGALGLEAARSLVRRGARHIALLGRNQPSPDAETAVADLREAGAQVVVYQGDVSDEARIVEVISAVRSEMAPIRGVVHAAGSLDDGMVRQLDWPRFESVFRAKVVGAWNLHRATLGDRVDLFVLYSSVASLLGSSGQTNYAAANAFLDALAHHRQASGLPALSINWAGWSDVGMAARLAATQPNRRNQTGIELVDPALGDEILGALLGSSAAQVGVLRVDWQRVVAQVEASPSPFLEQLIVEAATAGSTQDRQTAGRNLSEQLGELAPEERFQAVRDHVRAAIVSVLGLDSTTSLDGGYGLPDLGMDSLMAVELSNRLQRSTGLALASTVAFEHPSLDELSVYMADDLLGIAVPDDVTGAGGADPNGAASSPAKSGAESYISIQRVPRGEPIVASPAQQRLLFIDQLQPGTAMYNIPAAHRLRGLLDVAALEAALSEIVRRHESLRTNFDTSGPLYMQVIADPAPVVLRRVDLRGVTEGERDSVLAAELRDEAARSFDLRNDVKVRATLLQTDANEHVLALTVHHIASDGWSVARLYAELSELYGAFVNGSASPLAELAIQYADYAVWQHEQVGSARLRDQLDYWTRQLGGNLPVLQMPTDRTRPPARTYGGGKVRVAIPPELMARVATASRTVGVTPFAFLLASYIASLARWTGQEDIIVGTAAANRSRPETTDLIGLFANTLAIRVRLDLDAPFTSLLEEVRQSTLGAFAHQDVPFNRIVEEVRPPRDLTRSAVFQTMFVYNNVPMSNLPLVGVTGESVEVWAGGTEQDLSLSVTEAPDQTTAVMEFNTDVFDVETVQRFVGHWGVLLRGAVADPARNVSSLPLLTAGERQVVLAEWAASDVDVPAGTASDVSRVESLVGLRVVKSPGAVAVESAGEALTYLELDQRSNRLARYLRGQGVGHGDRVGVAVDRSVAMLVSLLGVLKAGAAYVPLDPGFPGDRLAFMVADAGARVVLVSQDSLLGRFDLSGLVVVDVVHDRCLIESQDASAIDVAGTGDDVAYVIYTSGSTGVPKGVEIEHRSVVNFLRSMLVEPGMNADDVLLAVTTLSFDISVLEIFLPLAAGARVVVAGREDAADGRRLAALIESSGATVVQATPTTWSMLFDAGWSGVAGLKVLCGGEAMPPALGRRLFDGCKTVWNMFGPTETTIWSTVFEVDESALHGRSVPIGRPIANTVVRVLDRRGEPAAIGVPGELYIGGAGVARGYLGRDELTSELFVEDPFAPGGRLYRTGDVARWRSDGNLDCLGRSDHQVKVRGHRIELGEIESALRAHEGVADAVVIADGAANTARLLAYIIPTDSNDVPAVAGLRALLRERVPDYMIPSLFVPIEQFPMTPNRKIDRNALPKPHGERVAEVEYVEPRNDVERAVADTFASTLNVETVGVIDNFFELGGHSLLATSLLARLANIFGINLELRSFFFDPTVAGVAGLLTGDSVGRARVERVAQIQVRLSQLSAEEVAEMLAARSASDVPAEGP